MPFSPSVFYLPLIASLSSRFTMAATINQVRLSLSKMFKSEQYSPFTLQSDGASHVEVKLSDDIDDHAPSEQAGQPGGSPSYRPRPKQNYRNVCYLVLGILFIFIIGYLIGYVSHRSPLQEPIPCDSEQEVGVAKESVVEYSLSWTNITSLLARRLTPDAFNSRLSDVEQTDHTAGSTGDNILGNHVFESFKSLEMEPWTDVHFVQLQTPNSEKPNRVLIGQDEVCQPKGYLAYSATGKAKGKAVYGNYGTQEDLENLHALKVELNGTVILLRASEQISLAQQVANVAALGVSAVLIYPEHKSQTTELYGHVHLGSGDPYTPGFPSFNHTQFPPTQSSGLPNVLAQSITDQAAVKILKSIGGPDAPSRFQGKLDILKYTVGGASSEDVTVEVNNVLQDTEIHNVFGVIKGFTEPDRYVVLGAQRDAWGPGYAKATVGTTLLLELARAVSEMVHIDGFRPRRSMVFASWSAGEYGSVGATEWLEGYLSSLDRRAFTYISLDRVVTGNYHVKASASPLLYSLLERTMKEVKNPIGFGKSGKSLYDQVSGVEFEKAVYEPMQMEDSAYPFLAFSGIPSLSFRIASQEGYPHYGTSFDNKENLGFATAHHLSSIATGVGLVAGQLALRLVHDHMLRLDVQRYKMVLSQSVVNINRHLKQVTRNGSADGLSAHWLIMALGSYSRAAADLNTDILNTDLTDTLACHNINNRIMRVEHNLLSPFVSPKEVPFRHLVFGHGSHTMAAILEGVDREALRTQLALATWTLQGCANALSGDVWDIDNQI
uniref:Transferrin receptor 1b n=1 Tax=Hucho hucho TaxID=62062 RepID=A0A4W5JGR2_9TELE